jgi:hypothetical protein
MIRRRQPKTAAAYASEGLLLIACVGLVACGGGTPPDAWASQVCHALGPWRTQISNLNAEASARMTTASTPDQARSHLLELLAGAEAATETARASLAAAGTPDVDGGEEVARRFSASLEGARDAYAHARSDLQALPTHDPARFYDGVVTVFSRLSRDYLASGLDPGKVDSVELRQAFDRIEQCR